MENNILEKENEILEQNLPTEEVNATADEKANKVAVDNTESENIESKPEEYTIPEIEDLTAETTQADIKSDAEEVELTVKDESFAPPVNIVVEEEKSEKKSFLDFFKTTKWKKIWDKITTALLILIMATPLLILAYILIWFLTK